MILIELNKHSMLNLLNIFKPKKKEGVKVEVMPRNVEEKIDEILSIAREIRDELKPLMPSGERISKLELILSEISKLKPSEREELKKKLEVLETDEQILKLLTKPKTIEEISKKLKKSYGYVAARLRELMKQGKVLRKRDSVTRKYVYMRITQQ